MTAALAACVAAPTPTLPPAPSPSPTRVAPTATLVLPTATIPPPTSTPVPATATPNPFPVITRIVTGLSPNPNVPPPVSITLILSPEPNLVTATFTARGNQTLVELNIRPSAPGSAYAAIMFEAFCAQPGTLRYTLTNIVDGKSQTTINIPIATVLSGALNLDIKKSTRPGDASLACIRIPEAMFIELKDGAQPGTIVAFDQAGGTEVDAFIKPGPPGSAQPALIFLGVCKELGAMRYSLNPIVDGTSKTFFGVRFLDFRREKGALNVHQSLTELNVSVACANLSPGEREDEGR